MIYVPAVFNDQNIFIVSAISCTQTNLLNYKVINQNLTSSIEPVKLFENALSLKWASHRL